MKSAELPEDFIVVVEQGPNTNGDIFPDRAQRLRDLADLSFRPSYVQSTPDLKNVFRPKETIGEAVINVHAVRRLRGGVGWDANGSPTEEWP